MKNYTKNLKVSFFTYSIGATLLFSFIMSFTAHPIPVSFGRLFILLLFTVSISGLSGFLMGMIWAERPKIEQGETIKKI